jgi:hypothetical protein
VTVGVGALFLAGWTWIIVWNLAEGRRLVSTGFV